MTALADLCHHVATAMDERVVIPFLGAGASLAGRERERDWRQTGGLPSGRELRDYFAARYRYPADDDNRTLARVAQFGEFEKGEPDLRKQLRKLFTQVREPTDVHRYLAETAARERAAGRPNLWPVIVTTNYDDLLETAFEQAGQPYEVVAYVAAKGRHGRFRHSSPAGNAYIGKQYRGLDYDRGTVIVKLHGTIDRRDPRGDSFVVTEDHYLTYMAKDVLRGLPTSLVRQFADRHFLFLGYRLEDWNLRVFLMRLWAGPELLRSWTILDRAGSLERRFWDKHGVTTFEHSLEEWVQAMRESRR